MTDDDLAIPSSTRLGTFRDYIEAVAQASAPTAVASNLLRIWFPTALDKNTAEFQEKFAQRLAALARDISSINERLAVAAMAQGCLSAARSATEEHLDYLANATARVMLSTSERDTRGLILLRIAGDLSADHVRVMRMYADPAGAAAAAGVDLVWQERDGGGVPRRRRTQRGDGRDDRFAHGLPPRAVRLRSERPRRALAAVTDGRTPVVVETAAWWPPPPVSPRFWVVWASKGGPIAEIHRTARAPPPRRSVHGHDRRRGQAC